MFSKDSLVIIAPDAVTERGRGCQWTLGLCFPASVDLSWKCEGEHTVWREVQPSKVSLAWDVSGFRLLRMVTEWRDFINEF